MALTLDTHWSDGFAELADALKMTGKCDCESCIKCQYHEQPFTLNTTSQATERLQLLHSDICDPLETPIGGGRYVLLYIDGPTRDSDVYIVLSKLEALRKLKERNSL
jgi:hypothetical protein